jgi:hypothetical protein
MADDPEFGQVESDRNPRNVRLNRARVDPQIVDLDRGATSMLVGRGGYIPGEVTDPRKQFFDPIDRQNIDRAFG